MDCRRQGILFACSYLIVWALQIPTAAAQFYRAPVKNAGLHATAYLDTGGSCPNPVPAPGPNCSQDSGSRDWYGNCHSYDGHPGTDFAGDGAKDSDVVAAASGVVFVAEDTFRDDCTCPLGTLASCVCSGPACNGPIECGKGASYGNRVRIVHLDGKTTLYGHLKKGSIPNAIRAPGSVVHCGDILGVIGSSGVTTGPHVHFEPRAGSVPLDPFSTDPNSSLWVTQGSYCGLPGLTCDSEPTITTRVNIVPGAKGFVAGEPVAGYFTITNSGHDTITLTDLLLDGRLDGVNDCSNYIQACALCDEVLCPDFPPITTTLAKGDSFSYHKTFTPLRPGHYKFDVSYRIAPPEEVKSTTNPSCDWRVYGVAGDGGINTASIDVTPSPRSFRSRLLAQRTEACATPPAITSIEVDPTQGCLGSAQKQWVTIDGTGFATSSEVDLNDGTTEYPIPAYQTQFVSSAQLKVCAGVWYTSDWTAQVTNSVNLSNVFPFTVSPPVSSSTIAITVDPTGSPNPVQSGGAVNLSVMATTDPPNGPIAYDWSAACPALGSNGTFSNSALRNPTWTAPLNTGAQRACSICVTAKSGDSSDINCFPQNVAGSSDTKSVDLIKNGDFQEGDDDWTVSTFGGFYAGTYAGLQNCDSPNCGHCPGYASCSNADGSGANNIDATLTQTISLPSNAASISFKFDYSITSQDTKPLDDQLVFTIKDLTANTSKRIGFLTNTDATSTCPYHSTTTYDLIEFKGHTVTLQFLCVTGAANPTVFRIDKVSMVAQVQGCSSADECDDGEQCTYDSCNNGACRNMPVNDPCDDGLFCNGEDTCQNGKCSQHAHNRCTGGDECNNHCSESSRSCHVAAGVGCSDDGNDCTDDQCDGSGSCSHTANSAPCDDGTYCNGSDTCDARSCSVHSGDPCSGSGQRCDESGQQCTNVAKATSTPTPRSSPTQTPTPIGTPFARISIGAASGVVGHDIVVAVALNGSGVDVAATQNDITMDGTHFVVPTGYRCAMTQSQHCVTSDECPSGQTCTAAPDCDVSPILGKNNASFTFRPLGCSSASCLGIRALVFSTDNVDVISSGSQLYTCKVRILPDTLPGIYPLVISGVVAANPSGARVESNGTDGTIEVLAGPTPTVTAISSFTPIVLATLSPTNTRTPHPTPVATSTSTPTATRAASPTDTGTVTPSSTVTVSSCQGDCNGDLEVTIDELLKLVDIALETMPLANCVRGDHDGNGSVTVDELVSAVNTALIGCPAMANATPTPLGSPSPTALTSGECARAIGDAGTGISVRECASSVLTCPEVGRLYADEVAIIWKEPQRVEGKIWYPINFWEYRISRGITGWVIGDSVEPYPPDGFCPG